MRSTFLRKGAVLRHVGTVFAVAVVGLVSAASASAASFHLSCGGTHCELSGTGLEPRGEFGYLDFGSRDGDFQITGASSSEPGNAHCYPSSGEVTCSIDKVHNALTVSFTMNQNPCSGGATAVRVSGEQSGQSFNAKSVCVGCPDLRAELSSVKKQRKDLTDLLRSIGDKEADLDKKVDRWREQRNHAEGSGNDAQAEALSQKIRHALAEVRDLNRKEASLREHDANLEKKEKKIKHQLDEMGC